MSKELKPKKSSDTTGFEPVRGTPPDFKSGALTTRPGVQFLAQKRARLSRNFQYIKVQVRNAFKCRSFSLEKTQWNLVRRRQVRANAFHLHVLQATLHIPGSKHVTAGRDVFLPLVLFGKYWVRPRNDSVRVACPI
jgi:hypothetical protein